MQPSQSTKPCPRGAPKNLKARLALSLLTAAWGASLCLGQSEPVSGANQAAPAGTLAFVGARIHPVSGPPIDAGVLIVEDGKLIAVGDRGTVPIPAGATVVDLSGRVVIPGLVDTHSHVGSPWGADSSSPLQSEVRAVDGINVREPSLMRARAGGLTSLNAMPGSGHLIGGQTVYLKLRRAESVEQLCYRFPDGAVMGGLKMANGTNPQGAPPFPETRAKAAALVRAKFIQAQEYVEQQRKAEADPEAKAPARDLGLEALAEVLSGRRIVHHHTHRADDILTVLRLSKEFGFRVVLHHVSEGWKVPQEIQAAGASCSVILVDSPGGKLEAKELNFETPLRLYEAGVPLSLHSDDFITDSRLFLRAAALAVRAGLPREAALEALTLGGARQLDLADRSGSLEVGKDADFAVLDGDPFSIYTRVQQTWIEGVKVFDLSDPEDRVYADGGIGAGDDRATGSCCAPVESAGGLR